jgi:hypothetical protein
MIIFDIDGTLSIVGDRLKYLNQKKKDWDSFYSACGEDSVYEPIAKLYRLLCVANKIIVVSGRRESCREDTLEWFAKHNLQLENSNLYMRGNNDYRQDAMIKPLMIEHLSEPIEMIFEDRKSVVDMWRGKGLVCLQVADGNF